MKTDHDQTPSRLQYLQTGVQCECKFFQLSVNEDAKRLKGSRCWVLTRFTGFDNRSNQFSHGQCGRWQLPRIALGDDSFGNAIGKSFFSIVTNHLSYLVGACHAQPVVNALALVCVHSHVQRAVLTERKASLWVVDLRRAHPQIHQYTGGAVVWQLVQCCESLMAYLHSGIAHRLCHCNRLRVFVEDDQLAQWGQFFQDALCMPASAKGCVDIGGFGLDVQRLDRLLQHDGGVCPFSCCHSTLKRKVAKHIGHLALHGLGLLGVISRLVPKFEMAAHAQQHHFFGDVGGAAQFR